MIIQNSSVSLPIRLINSAGGNATGIRPSDILNAIVQVIREDRTTTNIALVFNTNWFEIDSTQSPGIYHVVLSTSSTSILGQLQYSIYPAATAFVPFIGTDQVSTTPAAQSDVTGAISNIKGTQGLSISDIAGGINFNPTTDNLDALRVAITGIAGGIGSPWDALRASHMTSGTFGEAIRILYQAARGHLLIDKYNNCLTVYEEDGTTVLYTCPLLRNSVPASLYATERLQG